MMRCQVLTAALAAFLPACLTVPGDLGVAGGSGTDGGSGSLGDPSTGTGESTGVTSPSTGADETASTDTEPPTPVCDVAPGAVRRMTSLQFARAVEDVFGVSPLARPSDESFGIIPVAETTSADDQAALDAAGVEVAAAFDVAGAVSCELDVAGPAATACTESFIDEVAGTALRGQQDDEALLALAQAQPSFEDGIRAVVDAVVSSEAFVDVTPDGAESDGIIQLDGPSVALRLSLFLWNSVPDLELRIAGADGSVLDAAVLEQQVARMTNDGRHIRMQADFYAVLFGTRDLASSSRDEVFPGWSASLAAAMQEEQRRFIAAQLAQPSTTLNDLLTTSETVVNGDLAALYGDDIQGTAPASGVWETVLLDPQHRAGLLTQLAVLTANAENVPGYVAPSFRGYNLVEALHCLSVPPHPPSPLPAPKPGVDPREAWENGVLNSEACVACHILTDPLGFAFGAYDAIGRWDASHPDLSATDFDGATYDDAVDLSTALSKSETVQACVARRYYEFAVRRELDTEDDCTLDALATAFQGSAGELNTLVRAVALSDVFQTVRP